MKTSNIQSITLRVLFALTLTSISFVGLPSMAEAASCFTCHAPLGSATDIRPTESTYRNITTGSIRGSHAKHIPAVTVDTNTCVPCHGPAVVSTNHRNGFINVTSATAPGLTYSKGAKFAQSGSANLTLGTCSTASCHANVYGSGTMTTPVWGDAAANCTACHTTPIGATGPATGNHANTAGHAVACTSCHAAGTTVTAVPTAGHNDGNIDVANVGYATLDKAKGTAGTTCSAASCHASPVAASLVTTPAWGTTGNGCAACHTGVNAITASGPATGNHALAGHVVACTSCHEAGTTAINAPTVGHADGNIDVANVGYLTLNKTKGSAGTTCSAASCHASPVAATLIVTPAWGSTGNGCAACHSGVNAITATGPATGNHALAGHVVACTSCHAAGTTATAVPSVGHADGNIDVANVGYLTLNKTKGTAGTTCSAASCHASPTVAGAFITTPAWGTTGNGCAACHAGANAITISGPATGSHTTVAGHAVTCNSCHATGTTATSVPSTGHADGNIDVANVGYSLPNKVIGMAAGTCSAASCHASPVAATLIVTPAWGSTGNGCAACHTGVNAITATGPATGNHALAGHVVACTSCHEAGTTATVVPSTGHADGNIDVANVGYLTLNKTKGTAGVTCSAASCHASPVAATLVVTPAWGSTGNGCAACHSGVNVITATGPATGNHALAGHVVACTACHAAGTTATVVPSTGHADGNIDVANVGYLTLNKTKGTAGTTCSAASCHASPVAATLIVTPAWGTTGNGCAACHAGANVIVANGPATGSHGIAGGGHNVACTACHAAGTTQTVAPITGHADGDIDVANVGYATLNKAKGSAGTTCSAASCHDNGKGVPVISPAWGSTVPACTACHALQPADSSHTKHLNGLTVNFNRNANCNDCHAGTTQGVVAGAGHLDGNIDVTVGNYPANKVKGTAAASCTTSTCHSNGSAAYKPALWGATNAAGCNFCHDALPTSGSHTIHIGGTANYSFGCAECHGHNGAGTAHNDGVLNVVGGIGYNASKQCATSDCHSDGKATLAYKTSPAWGGTFTGDRCAGCHGNWPTGDAHLAHAVGIHYDDVSSKTGGKIASSATVASAVNAGHGDARYSTTISCYICHNTTVTAVFNDNSPTCSTAVYCHTAGGAGGLKGALTTASLVKATHVNRVRNVSFANTTVKNKAQLRDDITLVADLVAFWTRVSGYKVGASSHDESKVTLSASASFAAGSCANVVCHSGNVVNWTTGVGITCDKCHTGLPQ